MENTFSGMKHSQGKRENRVIDFMEMKRKKENRKFYLPKFEHLILGDPNNPSTYETYILLKHLVYEEKQILALVKKDAGCKEIILAEGVFDQGKLTSLKKIPTDCIYKLSQLVLKEIQNFDVV